MARSQSFSTMRRHLRLVLAAWLVLGVAIAVGLAFLRQPETAAAICRIGTAALGKELGFRLQFDDCSLDPLTATLRVLGLRGASADGSRSLSSDSLELRLRPLQALAGGLRVERLEVTGLKVRWIDTREPAPRPKDLANRPCWTGSLKLFRVEQLSLKGQSIEVGLKQGRASLKDLEVTSDLSHGAYHLALSAHGEVQRTGHQPVDLRALSLAGELDLPRDRAVVTSLGLTAGDLDLNASGAVEHLCHPEPELSVQLQGPVADVARTAGLEIPDLKGDLRLRASYLASHPAIRTGSPKPATVSADLSLTGFEADGYRAPLVTAKLSGNTQKLNLQTLHVQLAAQSSVELRGSLELKDKLPIELQLETHEAEFGHIMDLIKLAHVWPDFRANLSGRFTGHLLGGFVLSGSTSGDILNFLVDDTGWDLTGPRKRMLTIAPPVHIQTDLRIDKEGIHFEKAHLHSTESEAIVDALIHYDNRRGLKLHADLVHLDLGELKAIAGLPWSGQGSLSADVDGPYAALWVKARVDFGDFRLMDVDYGALRGEVSADIQRQQMAFPSLAGQRGATTYQIGGQLTFGTETRLDAQLRIGDGRLSDLFGALDKLHPVIADLRQDLAGSFNGTAEISGPVQRLDGQASLSFPDLAVFGRSFRSGELSLRLEGGRRVVVQDQKLHAGRGTLDASGSLLTSGDLDLQISAADLPLDKLLWPSAPPSARGLLGVNARLGGRLDAPRPSGTLTIGELEVLKVPLGEARADFSTEGRTLVLGGSGGDEVALRATAELTGLGPYHAEVELSTRRLERYLRTRFDVPPSGIVSGKLALQGQLLQPERSKGIADLDRVVIVSQRLRLENTAPVRIALDSGSLELSSTTLSAGTGKVTVAGTLSDSGDLVASVNGDLEARSLEGLLPRVERLGGTLKAQASIRGPIDAPAVVGSLTLEQSAFSWRGLPLSFSRLAGEIDFSQHKAILEGLHGELNGGTIELGGELLLEGFTFRRYDLSGTLRDVSLRIPQEISSRVGGTLRLTGDPDRELSMAGSLDVAWARYTKAFDLETLTEKFRGGPAVVPEEGGAPLKLDIQLHGNGGDLRVDNDLVHMALAGDLRLTGTSDSPGLLGSVNSHDGFADFRGYRYHISQATFTFTDADQIAAAFDITADTTARQYRVFVHAFGTPQQYQLQLSSQPSLSEEDVVKLLTIGVTSQDSVASATTAGTAGYIGDVLWNISGLHDQVRRFIPRNDLIKDFSLNLGSAFIESTGQVEPVAQIESRVLTDRFRLRAQLPLSETAGKRAEAEYQLDDHFSVQGEWNNDYADYNIGDFGLDLRARWEFGE